MPKQDKLLELNDRHIEDNLHQVYTTFSHFIKYLRSMRHLGLWDPSVHSKGRERGMETKIPDPTFHNQAIPFIRRSLGPRCILKGQTAHVASATCDKDRLELH